jgi:hypothetical protein
MFSFALQISFWQFLQNPHLWLHPQYYCHIPEVSVPVLSLHLCRLKLPY